MGSLLFTNITFLLDGPVWSHLSFPKGGIWVLLVMPRFEVICLIALLAVFTYLLGGMWSPMTRPFLLPQ